MPQRVLVIDDVQDILVLAALSLEALGIVTLTAHDGLEGIQVANSTWPDLILCDVHMPKLDGFGVLSAIRSNAATANIPVVFVTGDHTIPARAQQLPVAPNGCLTKPFSHADLAQMVAANITATE